MDGVVLAGRLLLAAVFALAATTKLRDRDGTARAITELAGGRYATLGARMLPVAELAVAVTLLIRPLAVVAAVASAVLLSVFTVAVVKALREGRRPDCGCFGNLRSEPVSAWTAGRNVNLSLVALLVALRGPGGSLGAPFEVLIVAGLVAAGVRLGRRPEARAGQAFVHRAAPEDRRGIPIGLPAPEFELHAADGGARSLASLRRAGRPVVLMFLGARCGACSELHPHLRRWQLTLSERLVIAIVMSGDADPARALYTDHGVQNVLVDDGDDPLWTTYRMAGTPSGVVVAPDGSIASAAVRGGEALEALVRETVRRGAETSEAWKQPSPVG